MVTTLRPDRDSSHISDSPVAAARPGNSQYSDAELEKFLNEVYGNLSTSAGRHAGKSSMPKGKTTFIKGVARPLLAMYQLLSGPPMTQRERTRQAITEARTRSTASLNWFQRTPL